MGRLFEDKNLRDKVHVFKDRVQAGKMLAEMLSGYNGSNAMVVAIPAGGVVMGAIVAERLGLDMELVVVRKIQLPYNTEAGFGAIDPDNEVVFNRELVKQAGLTSLDIEGQIKKAQNLLNKRNLLFRSNRPFPDVSQKTVIITDDGLASGYTMLSAIKFLRRRKPFMIIVAVPTGSSSSIELVLNEVDELYCLNVRSSLYFAVAEAYIHWYDLTDDDVIRIMDSMKK
jgi:predicted phosphoribosyltransferase